MTSGPYHNFLYSLLGPNYKNFLPIVNNINTYCLYVLCLFILLMIYFVHRYDKDCENSFAEKVKLLRLKS
jgi:hypothetical protein